MSAEVANPPPQIPIAPDSPNRGGGSPRGSTPRSQRHSREKALAPLQNGKNEVTLPDLKSSDNAMDKTKPLPTSLQSDFIPEDVLLSLTMPSPPVELLGPPSRYRNLNTSTNSTLSSGRRSATLSASSASSSEGPVKKPSSNVWNHPKRRDKFKHLTESTICICGAGRDISFLYDVPNKGEKPSKPAVYDQSAARLDAVSEGKEKQPIQLPDSLIPEEYHIVKNKGVMGLEFHDDKYVTRPEDHEKHLVVFPSMNPTSRYEVLQLKKALDDMMTKAGVDEELALEGARETQLHKLLELIKKEQDIYNIVFHEIIRQVSIECIERGELLSSVRHRYHELLNKVPRQVKSLHEEVMAQRALDRRLTEELMRFKNTIGVLTHELTMVKEHDRHVTSAASGAQDELKQALADSQKNASLLAEYHDLYELQRNRLELQVSMLTDEKELWSTAAYSLALKVTEERNLQTAKRLHICEKAWQKLANHFTILLSDQDTGVLTKLQSHVDIWRDLSEVFNFNMKRRDEAMRECLRKIKTEMEQVRIDFEKNHIGAEGTMLRPPDKNKIIEYYNCIKSWEEMIAEETEKFGGDVMLTMQEELTKIEHEMYGWTDAALKVFNRHRNEDGSNYADHDSMLKMNETVEELVKQYQIRLTGDNGVARGFIHLSNVLETWDTRLNTVLHGSNPMPDAEWTRFYQLLEDWINSVDEAYVCIGLTQKEEDSMENKPHTVVEYIDAVKLTQRWVSSATNGIDSEDGKLVEQVSVLHTEMVKWMVQMLLRIAPDMEENSAEAREMVLLGSLSVNELQVNAKSMFERLDSFTRYVNLCCNNIVKDTMQKKLDAHEENADHEYKELQRFKGESDEWIETAILLLHELTGEMIEFRPASSGVKVAESKVGKDQLSPYDVGGRKISETGAKSALSETAATDRSGLDPSRAASQRSASVMSAVSETSDRPRSANEQMTSEKSGTEQAAGSEAPPSGEGGSEQQEVDGPPSDKPEPAASPVPPTQEQATSEVQEEDGQDSAGQEEQAPQEREPTPPQKEEIQMIGYDQNTRYKSLEQGADQPPSESRFKLPDDRQETPNAQKAYEALAAVETLQLQLLSAEERAQSAEGRSHKLEEELNKALETVRALERKLAPSASEESVKPGVSPSEQAKKDSGTTPAKPGGKKKDEGGKGPRDKRSDSQASVKSVSSKSSTKSKKR